MEQKKYDPNYMGKKDTEWIKQRALELSKYSFGTSAIAKKKDKICWKYYNGSIDEEDYEYLEKEGNNYLPAKVRSMNILRTPVNLLRSHQSRRNFVFDIFIDDKEGKKEKYNKQMKSFYDAIYNEIVTQKSDVEFSIQMMYKQIEELQSYLQQEPENEEMQMQQQTIQQQLPYMQKQISLLEKQMTKLLEEMDMKMEHLNKMYLTDYKDIKEEKAISLMKDLINTLDVGDKTLDAFTDNIVTGKEYLYVDIDEETNEMIFKDYNSLHVSFPSSTNNKYVQLEKWVQLHDICTLEDILVEYGENGMLSSEDIEELKQTNYPTVALANSDLYQGQSYISGISRVKIFFRAPIKKIKRKTETSVDLYDIEDIKTKQKGDEYRYDEEIFCAVVLNNKHVAYAKKKKYVYQEPKTKRKWLPLVGETFSGIYKQPFSLIWQAKDFQEMYRIINHYKELLIAVSGVKGMIIDISQKPGDMSPSEQRHYRKKGTLYIETMKKGGQTSPYNQWKDYDDSLPASIQYVEQMLANIIETCWMLMGVPRQRLGVTVADEAVGNAQLANEQSILLTEILHHQHDNIVAQAYKMLINLYAEYKNDEDLLIFGSNDMRYGSGIEIPKDIFKGRKFDIYCLNTMKNQKIMDDLKLMAVQQYQKNAMALHDAVQFYSATNVKELEMNLRAWSEKAQKIQQVNAEKEMQKTEEIERMKIELPKQMDAQMQQAKNEIEQFRAKLEEARIAMEKDKIQIDAKLKQYDIDTNKELKLTDIATEREIEGSYLNEQKRSAVKNEQLQTIQLEISAMKMQLDAMIGKISAEAQKIAATNKGKSKEHLKDN